MTHDSSFDRPRGPTGLVHALGRLDTMLFVITAVVVLDTVGAVAVAGPEAFTWLVAMGVLFLVPSALVTAELGAAFPAEGGHYVWTRLAFGRVAGAVSALLYWIETPIWIGGSLAITAIAVTEEFVAPLGHAGRLAFALGFVWLAVAATLAPIRLGRLVPASGAIARVALIALFSATVGIYAVQHGVHGFAAAHLTPTGAGFAAFVPVLLYNYLGFDVPAAAAGEMRDPQRDLPTGILRAGVWTFVLYAVPVLSVLLVLPPERITGLTGFVAAMREVFTVYGPAGDALGTLAGALFVWALISSGGHVADGQRPQPGRRLPGRRRTAAARHLLETGHARAPRPRLRRRRQLRVGRDVHDRGLQRRALLRGRAVAVDRRHRPLLRRHLRGAAAARGTRTRRSSAPSACPAAPSACGSAAGCRWPGRSARWRCCCGRRTCPRPSARIAPRSSSRRSCRSR